MSITKNTNTIKVLTNQNIWLVLLFLFLFTFPTRHKHKKSCVGFEQAIVAFMFRSFELRRASPLCGFCDFVVTF